MTRPMDNLRVDIAPGADLSADESTWTWVEITEWLRDEVSIPLHGRRDEAADSGPDECEIRVENDGRFIPDDPTGQWYGDLDVGTPLRVYWSTTADIRFQGNITELPVEWSVPTSLAWSTIRASGPSERIQRGSEPLNSPLHRSVSMSDDVVAYWPCEDGSEAAEAASPLDGVPALVPSGVEFGASRAQSGSTLFGASSVMKIPDPSRNVMGRVPNHTPGLEYLIELAWMMPDTATSTRAVMDVRTTSSTHARWQLRVSSTQFQVRAWDADDVEVENETEAVGDVFGRWIRAELFLSDDGLGVLSWIATLYAMDAAKTQLNQLVAAPPSSVLGRVTQAGVNGPLMSQERYAGHILVRTDPGGAPLRNAGIAHEVFRGYPGERAMTRFERLCDEQGLQCTAVSGAPKGVRRPVDTETGEVSCPNAAALDITGDIDLRADVSVADWSQDASVLVAKSTSGEISFRLSRLSDGTIQILWSTDGSSTKFLNSTVPVTVPAFDRRRAVRATLDVDNGSMQHEATFYTAESFADAAANGWTQLGDVVTGSGTTSIHSGTADLEVMGRDGGTTSLTFGVMHGAEVYDGIAGTLVADPDFSAEEQGTSSFSDGQGNTWTLNDPADIGHVDDSMPMGPQPVDTLLANLRDCARADDGRLYEHMGGFTFRTRTSLYKQTAALTLVPEPHMPTVPRPTRDNQRLVNELRAERPDGTSVTARDQASIDKRGRYGDRIVANVATDDWLLQYAYWWLNRGTVSGLRWPRIPVRLSPSNTGLISDWLAVRIGDRIVIDHEFPQLPGVTVDLLVEGWSESWDSIQWDVVLNCIPAALYSRVAVFGTDRFDASDTSSTLNAALNDSATSFDVATTGQPWVNDTDHAAEFPFDVEVGGEVMTVSGITGSTSPQTFSVTRSVNGVTKSHSSGDSVRLAQRPVFA